MQKTKLFLLLFFVSIIGLSAQEITGNVTSENGEGVPFTNIFLRERNIGIVSDINGHYRLPLDILENVGDTLIFSSIGFDTQRFPVAEFAEKVAAGNTDIMLIANYVLLPVVVVTPNIHEPRDYGFFHLRAASVNFLGSASQRFMVFIENTDNVTKFIQTVNIRLRGRDLGKFEKLRVFFYQKTENGFQNINVGEDIFITDFSNLRIRHDVSENHIPFPAEGIFVGFEWVGEENVVRDRASRANDLGVSATTRVRTPNSWLFLEEEWGQFPPEGVTEVIDDIPRLVRGTVRRVLLYSNFQIGITAH